MRDAIKRKLAELLAGWDRQQHQPVRWFNDTELSDAQLARYSLLLLGDAQANAVSRKLGASLPLTLAGDVITLAGRAFRAPDAVAVAYAPHPRNPGRGIVTAAATSPGGMALLPVEDDRLASYDFFILDGAVGNPVRGRPAEKVRVAAGLFDRGWRIDESVLELGDPAVRARCPRLVLRAGTLVPAAAVPPAQAEMLAGKYQLPAGTFEVVRDGERLLLKVPQRPPLLLVPEGELVFGDGQFELTFEVKQGKSEAVTLRVPGQPAPVRATRAPSAAEGPRR
jgi:hypothetical protein